MKHKKEKLPHNTWTKKKAISFSYCLLIFSYYLGPSIPSDRRINFIYKQDQP